MRRIIGTALLAGALAIFGGTDLGISTAKAGAPYGPRPGAGFGYGSGYGGGFGHGGGIGYGPGWGRGGYGHGPGHGRHYCHRHRRWGCSCVPTPPPPPSCGVPRLPLPYGGGYGSTFRFESRTYVSPVPSFPY